MQSDKVRFKWSGYAAIHVLLPSWRFAPAAFSQRCCYLHKCTWIKVFNEYFIISNKKHTRCASIRYDDAYCIHRKSDYLLTHSSSKRLNPNTFLYQLENVHEYALYLVGTTHSMVWLISCSAQMKLRSVPRQWIHILFRCLVWPVSATDMARNK